MTSFRHHLLPGVALLVVIGLSARLLSETVLPVNHLLLAVAIGAILSNTVSIPASMEPGVSTHKLLLEAGIVLMGARLSLEPVIDSGVVLFLTVGVVLTGVILYTELLARQVFELDTKLGSLLAAGSSVCGVSAIAAVAGGIRANEDHIAYAVATVLLFDAVTLFAYPLIGGVLNLPDRVFGVWAGLSMFSTGPVTAAGFTYSEVAGQWAVLTKLTRNALIGVVAIAYSVLYAVDRTGTSTDVRSGVKQVWESFPKFVLGFVLVVAIANANLLSGAHIDSVSNAYRWFFLLAFSGLGLSIQVGDMRETGIRPVALILIVLATSSVVSLGIAATFFAF